ncbi:LppP/LprE family lipoprotein [Gordonia sihwensis]|uniref:LppP/LprE family lipoprotein n=1 Tax=Gordonia sihwensis TaxID=173559 RepID=UPI003D97B0DB
MRISQSVRGVTAVAALGLALTACTTAGTATDAARSATTAESTVPSQSRHGSDPKPDAQQPTAQQQETVDEPGVQPPAAADRDVRSTPVAQTTSVADTDSDTDAGRPGSGHGLCFDLNSALARDAIATLGPDSNGGSWVPRGASEHPLAHGCGLDWMLVDGSGFNDATYTSRVLLFAGGQYLGTVEPHEYSYTSVAGDTLNSVTVRYRWLRDDDPFCCPQGGPTDVTATLSGGAVVRSGQFPPSV